eukprot:GEMP01011433.1.p1 GENE.GEMP01011433.1~~GEMP01011433.1.p1  ORF type:complete len:596 (-),score=163.75 GEMP01011433.1:1343-3130(-)
MPSFCRSWISTRTCRLGNKCHYPHNDEIPAKSDEIWQVAVSINMSNILRHSAQKRNIQISPNGYVKIVDMLQDGDFVRLNVTMADVHHAVRNNSKQRFELSSCQTLIRCVQGHSMQAVKENDLLTQLITPPPQAIHGTYGKAWLAIRAEGLRAMERNHIHFAEELCAISGMRYNCEVAIYVDARKMMSEGMLIYRAKNGVILSSGLNGVIAPSYFTKVVNLATGKELSITGSANYDDDEISIAAPSHHDDDDDDDDEPMPPAEAPKENDWKDEMKAERWFAQGIFANVEQKDDVHSSDGDGDISEMDEKDIVQLPLTDKQRRQKMRAKNRKKSERKKAWEVDEFGGEAVDEEKEKHEKVEVVPAFTPAEGALCATPPSAMTAPTDVREKAEIQALGSLMIRKKSRMDIIDAAYNRFVFEDIPDQLPEWFVEEENRFNKPELPISKELMEQFNAKLREINARPIRKVAEAQARKKKRLTQRMDKLRKEAKAMAENHDMSAGAKARNMERMMRKAKGEDKRTNKTMFIKKGGGGTDVGKKGAKLGKNVKTKVVDKRLKADKRGLKIAAKKNKKKGLKKKPNKSVKKIKGKKGSSRRR